MKTLLPIVIVLNITCIAQAQRTSPIGRWKTVDDATGKVKSEVEVYERGGKIFGKVLKLYDPDKPDPVCEKCDKADSRHMKKVVGLEVIRNMVRDGHEWEGGDILDPENGKVYRCKLWVEEGKLQVRGYIAFLYRTQIWLPAN